ncbi:c-type heme family protein [Fundidesulfovibrio terrae]|uniref:c-type heme family protein n=1 Tax=Fundidesulfovibrio terrae TaxID=2922866 RepID=UPI001FAF3B5A|nr:DUF3365 domain-containing protein [Fundidesulfovibrio terrae]
MKKARLQTRLLLRLLAVMLGIGLVFGLSLNHYLRVLLETEVADKADLVFSNVLAMQTYVRESLRPTMFDILPQDGFVMEAMSTSYVTRKVMSDLNGAKDKFTYRRVALDPRNPEYGANAMEGGLIAHFQAHPEARQVNRYYTQDGQEYFLTARPVVFDESCLSCHGSPSAAPKVLLTRYGSERGFGRHEGEIAGLDSIIMPVDSEARAISRVLTGFIVVFACGCALILGTNHLFFDRMTVVNIGRLAALMRSRFPAEAGRTLDNPPRPPRRGGGEIEGMIADMERFADHLRDARQQLKDYAVNLEGKVLERTAEARREADARSADVRLFLHVLELFVKGADRAALLDRALEAVAGRFGADAAGFSCFYSMSQRCWPASKPVPPLSGADREALFDGRGVFGPGLAVVGVHAAGTVRGALSLRWDGDVELSPREREVLAAVGHQLGIALENLEAMENLLRQKTVLESIFEGIADPLFLLSGAGEVLHANESANQLLAALGGDAGLLGFAALAAETGSASDAAISQEVLLPGNRSLILRAYPLEALGGPGGLGRAIVYARDNSVEKTMMARLQQSEKSLALGLLSAGLAHEINNPLGVILCYARLLWDDGKSPHAPDLDIIIRYTLQAQKVLEDLMRFARPKPESVGPVELEPAARFIARVFKGKAAKTGIEIVTGVPDGLAPVRANASALEQVLTNLLLNALDALEEQAAQGGGRVSIEARQDKSSEEVLLIVRDNGPGIPTENLSRLFDPFFTTKSVGKGTGLGLSVVYGLVSGLGGHIEASNDGGAVFTVHLPVWADSPEESDD